MYFGLPSRAGEGLIKNTQFHCMEYVSTLISFFFFVVSCLQIFEMQQWTADMCISGFAETLTDNMSVRLDSSWVIISSLFNL